MALSNRIQAIIPAIVIAELLWKLRKWGKMPEFQQAYSLWKQSPNIIIDIFDSSILDLMIKNSASSEVHDEIIAMTCLKYHTKIISAPDENFSVNYQLILRKW